LICSLKRLLLRCQTDWLKRLSGRGGYLWSQRYTGQGCRPLVGEILAWLEERERYSDEERDDETTD
jgi:hypothetical protein